MEQKIRPAQLGCGRPYFSGYSTRLLAKNPEDEEIISNFIKLYNSTCFALYQFFRELFKTPENHLALYALLLPGRAPDSVQQTRFWRENIKGETEPVKGEAPGRKWADPTRPAARTATWTELNCESTYALLTVLATPKMEDISTRPARTWQQMIAEYDLKCQALDDEKLETIFKDIPDMETRRRIGESVGAVLRSYLSQIERAKETTQERKRTVDELEGRHPGFFKELLVYEEDFRSWQRSCRYFNDLRRRKKEQLKETGLKQEVISRVLFAVQRAAMRQAMGRMISWHGLQPATLEDDALVAQHPGMVDEFIAAVTMDDKIDPFEEDVFRRFASRNALPIKLAEDPVHLAKIIDMYHRTVSPLSSELLALLAQRQKIHNKRTIHAGWQTVCGAIVKRSKKDPLAGGPEAKKLHQFIMREVRTWFQNLRPIRKPQWPEKPAFWPRLQEGMDWEEIADAKAPWGNSIEARLRIPTPNGRAIVEVNLRGNLSVAKAKKIDPLNVANGLSQFRPNQELLQVARTQSQKTYVKLQSMRLMKEDNTILVHISATQMTESLHAADVTKDFANSIRHGERLLVMHLYPGGRRLAQMVMFERKQAFPGWKHLPIEEIIPDTGKDSFSERNGKRIHVQTQRKGSSGFIVLDETSYLLRRAYLEKFSRDSDPKQNAALMQKMGDPKRNLGDIHYKQLAARIAALCRFNRIGYVLIAGTGRLMGAVRSEEGGKPIMVTAPTHQFVSIRKVGSRRQIQGSLVNALQKSGTTALFASARAKNIWVRPFLQQQTTEGCIPALPYHEDPTQEAGRTYRGKRTLIAPDDQSPGFPYPLNASWAILLDWSRQEFSEHIDKVLAAAV